MAGFGAFFALLTIVLVYADFRSRGEVLSCLHNLARAAWRMEISRMQGTTSSHPVHAAPTKS